MKNSEAISRQNPVAAFRTALFRPGAITTFKKAEENEKKLA